MASQIAPAPLTEPDSTLERLWAGLHPAPPLPLEEPFTAGLGPLLDGLGRRAGGVLNGPRARQVVAAVGSRYSVTVDAKGVSSRGLLRRRNTDWDRAEKVVLEPLAAMAARRLVGKTASSLLGRYVPIPGLRWLAGVAVQRVAEAVADASASVLDGSPTVLVAVRSKKGAGVNLEGPLALTSLLSRGLTEAVVDEAVRRGIPVVTATD